MRSSSRAAPDVGRDPVHADRWAGLAVHGRNAGHHLMPTAPEHPGSGNAPRNRTGDAGQVRLRCLIIDDSPLFLEAARALLELDGISVVAVASTTAEAVQRVQDL